jgi:hypothetical protein
MTGVIQGQCGVTKEVLIVELDLEQGLDRGGQESLARHKMGK